MQVEVDRLSREVDALREDLQTTMMNKDNI